MIIKYDPILFTENALKNFSVPGLYSFILERNGNLKRRLFVFDPSSANSLQMNDVPLHMHKYIDVITPLFGLVCDVLYIKKESVKSEYFCKYKYSRLSDVSQHPIINTDEWDAFTLDSIRTDEHVIESFHYHTVNAFGLSAWIINEIDYNPLFTDQHCYLHKPYIHGDTKKLDDISYIIDLLKSQNIYLESL